MRNSPLWTVKLLLQSSSIVFRNAWANKQVVEVEICLTVDYLHETQSLSTVLIFLQKGIKIQKL